jgi:DNA ligase-1
MDLTMNATQPSILDTFLTSVKKFDAYPMLYSRTSTGAVQTWKVEVQGDKYRFHTGQKGGAIITTEWTTCKGKNPGKANQTTPEEQAAKEAKAAMAKKLKSGGYWENESDIDRVRFFAPMLAHKYVDLNDDNTIKSRRHIDWSKGVWVSPKMDGLRCIINREGAFSRMGNKFASFPHIPRELQQLFIENPDLVLDGECYAHALKADFDKLISLAKKQKPKAAELTESEANLEYHIFDCPTAPGGYTERYAWLQKMIQRFANNRWIKLCEHKHLFSEAELDAYLTVCIQQGFEGCMMNMPDAAYEADKRSYSILKYKLFMDAEFEIIDVIEGDGNRSGMMGRCIMKLPKGGTFDCDSKGNRDFFKRLLADKKNVIGKKATVRFQNYTPDGKPRFAKIIAIRDYE